MRKYTPKGEKEREKEQTVMSGGFGSPVRVLIVCSKWARQEVSPEI